MTRPAKDAKADPFQDDPYRELRARLVEQMAESCTDRIHGESLMVTLLQETRARALEMSEELGLAPERCAEAIQRLEKDLGLDTKQLNQTTKAE